MEELKKVNINECFVIMSVDMSFYVALYVVTDYLKFMRLLIKLIKAF